jgi:hypothetical protein
LLVIHTVIKNMAHTGQFKVVSQLIMQLQFKKILELQEAEVFVAKAHFLWAMDIKVGPLN